MYREGQLDASPEWQRRCSNLNRQDGRSRARWRGKAPQRLRAVGLQLPEANTIKRLNPSVLTESDNVKAVGAAVPRATSEDGVVHTSETSGSRQSDN